MRTNRFTLRSAILAGLAITLLLAGPAGAQGRPSLERLEQYACIAADERGDSYRPIFCDGRCDCLEPEVLSGAQSCAQGMNGMVSIVGVPVADAECLGVCGNGTTPCFSNSECGGNTCFFSSPFPYGSCAVRASIGCSEDADCDEAKGYYCAPYPNGGSICVNGACSAEGVCDTGVWIGYETFTRTIGFAPLGDPTPVSCDTGGNISSTDVAECIAQVEAHLGAGACVICGDGNLDVGEQCDDGNLDPGDGCAPNCTTE